MGASFSRIFSARESSRSRRARIGFPLRFGAEAVIFRIVPFGIVVVAVGFIFVGESRWIVIVAIPAPTRDVVLLGMFHLPEHLHFNALKVHLNVQVIQPLPADDLRDIARDIQNRCYKESSGSETRAHRDTPPRPAGFAQFRIISQPRRRRISLKHMRRDIRQRRRLTNPPDVTNDRLPINRHRQRWRTRTSANGFFRPSGRFGRQFSE